MASSSRYHSEQGSGCSSTTDHCDIQEAKKSALLGLKLVKTQALLSLLEMKAATATAATTTMGGTKRSRDININEGSMSEKLKASNFPITTISIGAWKRVSRKEGELTAKLYFAKRKLVWEFLDGQLKSKMEVAWSDIIAIKATMLPNQHGILQIELGNPPLFFREVTPQPRKHTNWQQASDFTDGQAPLYRIHYASFPPGALDNHYEKLLQCDQNLYELSKRPFPSHQSPFFNTALPLQINIVSSTSRAAEQQHQQPSCRFHHQYLTPSMASSLHSTSRINPIITQGAINNLSHMDERNSEARAAMWGNQTTFVDSSLIDRKQQYDGSTWEYPAAPPPPFNYQNVNNINIVNPAAGNMYDLQSGEGVYDYGYGGRELSAADEQELMKINGDERYQWLIPHILGTVAPNSNSGIGIANQILNPYPLDPTSTTNTTQGFTDMHPYL